MKNLYKIENELYIVSSSEKIKENTQTHIQGFNGDWFYNTIYNFIARTGDITPYDFKIILTTNKLLIKDGVQPINDEFLEWFVKNPSCEEVEIEKICNNCGDINCIHAICSSQISKNKGVTYKIIIPKEEPKKELIELKKQFQIKADEALELNSNIGNFGRPKQETSEDELWGNVFAKIKQYGLNNEVLIILKQNFKISKL